MLFKHPMKCAICGRALTTKDGTALVNILVRDGAWACDAHRWEFADEPPPKPAYTVH